jgi:hypothetical protein
MQKEDRSVFPFVSNSESSERIYANVRFEVDCLLGCCGV